MTIKLESDALEVLKGLFIHGPLFDGDVPSKAGRNKLHELGLCTRYNGYQTLTHTGLIEALDRDFDRDKERHQRTLREQREALSRSKGDQP